MSRIISFLKRYRQPAWLLLLCLFASCATIDDAGKVRREHIHTFTQELSNREQATLHHKLSLNDCISLAMQNNYDVLQADLKASLSKVTYLTSFSYFLPQVTANAGVTTWGIPQSASGLQIADKTYRTQQIQVMIPILVPTAYFMYQNAKLGINVASLSAHYVRQMVLLQTAYAYYQILITEDVIKTLETQVEAARTACDRIRGLANEGMAADWEGKQADYLYLARKAALDTQRRNLTVAQGDLLKLLGLSPLATLELKRDPLDDTFTDVPIADLVFTALQQHPSLSIADHQVVISENDVRMAIADFLPNITSVVNAKWTSDSFAKHVQSLSGSFTAAMDLFKGLSKVTTYKSAKLARKASEYDRESMFLTIILEVLKTRNGVLDAETELKVAQASRDYLHDKYADYEAKQKEGLVPINDVLDAQGDYYAAEATLARAKYQKRIALYQLSMAMGGIKIPGEEDHPLMVKPIPLTPETPVQPDTDDKPAL